MEKTSEYKGYVGNINFSKADGCYFGRLLGIRSLISYEGKDETELAEDFKKAIDEYLALCEENGWEPEKPTL